MRNSGGPRAGQVSHTICAATGTHLQTKGGRGVQSLRKNECDSLRCRQITLLRWGTIAQVTIHHALDVPWRPLAGLRERTGFLPFLLCTMCAPCAAYAVRERRAGLPLPAAGPLEAIVFVCLGIERMMLCFGQRSPHPWRHSSAGLPFACWTARSYCLRLSWYRKEGRIWKQTKKAHGTGEVVCECRACRPRVPRVQCVQDSHQWTAHAAAACSLVSAVSSCCPRAHALRCWRPGPGTHTFHFKEIKVSQSKSK
jgi:hypothetical protein